MTESPNDTLATCLAGGCAVQHGNYGRRRTADRGVMTHPATAVGDFDAVGRPTIGQRAITQWMTAVALLQSQFCSFGAQTTTFVVNSVGDMIAIQLWPLCN